MRTYNIYLDRIETSFENCTDCSLRYKLVSLSKDLLKFYYSLPFGIGTTYRSLGYLIEDLVNTLDFEYVDQSHLVGILRNSLSSLPRFKFSDFQINILNHV